MLFLYLIIGNPQLNLKYTEYTHLTNPTMHLSNFPQRTIFFIFAALSQCQHKKATNRDILAAYILQNDTIPGIARYSTSIMLTKQAK